MGQAHLTIAELKIALERHNVTYTREQNNKAGLLSLLSAVLKQKNIEDVDFLKEFRYWVWNYYTGLLSEVS